MTLQVEDEVSHWEFPSELEGRVSDGEDSSDEDEEPPPVEQINNNAKLREISKNGEELAHIVPMDDDKIDEEEQRSMFRFARFLEKNGFIRQERNGTSSRTMNPPPPRRWPTATVTSAKQASDRTTESGKNQGQGNSVDASNSELTLYQRAVRLDLNDSDKGNESDKRLTSSSEEGGVINTSDKFETGEKAVNIGMSNDMIANNANQSSFETFVGKRLSEY